MRRTVVRGRMAQLALGVFGGNSPRVRQVTHLRCRPVALVVCSWSLGYSTPHTLSFLQTIATRWMWDMSTMSGGGGGADHGEVQAPTKPGVTLGAIAGVAYAGTGASYVDLSGSAGYYHEPRPTKKQVPLL